MNTIWDADHNGRHNPDDNNDYFGGVFRYRPFFPHDQHDEGEKGDRLRSEMSMSGQLYSDALTHQRPI